MLSLQRRDSASPMACSSNATTGRRLNGFVGLSLNDATFLFLVILGRRLDCFLGLSLNDRTILLLAILLDKTVSVG